MSVDKDNDLVIKFPNKERRDDFIAWMDNQGEQDYWVWEECRDFKENLIFTYGKEGVIDTRLDSYGL